MSWLTTANLKYALAGIGVLYLVVFAGYLVYAGMKPSDPVGPSELALHPEREDEILARRRAEEMQAELKLTEAQTQRIADIMSAQSADEPFGFGPGGGQGDGPGGGDFRGRFREMQEQIEQVLTPEQRALLEAQREQFRGRGGPGAWMTPERIESLKEKMRPDQRERFEKALEQWQRRRPGGRGERGGGPGGMGGPGRPGGDRR